MLGKTQMGAVKSASGLALIGVLSMPSRPGTAGRIMSAMGAHELNIEFIAQTMGAVGKDNVAFCVKQERADEAVAVLEKMKHELKAQTISRRDNVGLVFTFGPEFRFTPGTAGRVFKLLGGQDINIIAISTSMAAITCVIDDDRIADAVTALKAVFETP